MAPEAQSSSLCGARQELVSQIGFVTGQSVGPMHCTQLPELASHSDASANREQSSDDVHGSQTSVVMLQTGAATPQPACAHDGTVHWCSTHARPSAQPRTSAIPTSSQSAVSRQHTAGFGRVHAANAEANATAANVRELIPIPFR